MKYKQLGRTGLYVSELCLGTMTSLIIGAKRIDQLDDNLGAVDVVLTDDELARLDAVSALPPCYPGWMIARREAGRVPAPFTRGAAQ